MDAETKEVIVETFKEAEGVADAAEVLEVSDVA